MSKNFNFLKSNNFNSPRLLEQTDQNSLHSSPSPESSSPLPQLSLPPTPSCQSQVQLWIPRFSFFLASLKEQTRRISPAFKFENPKGNLLEQVLQSYKQSVDIYLEKYQKNIVSHSKRSSHCEDPTSKSEENIEDIQTAKETMKNLMKYEKLLNAKEEKILIKAEKLQEDLENFKIIKENFENYLKNFENEKVAWHENKMKEMEKIDLDKKKLNAEKKRIEKLVQDLQGFKEKVESKEAEAFSRLKVREEQLNQLETQIYQRKEDLDQEISSFKQEKLSFESEKWSFQGQISGLSDQQALLKLKQDHLDQEKLELIQEKQLLCDQKSKLEQEKHEFSLIRKSSPTKPHSEPEPQSSNDQSVFNLSFEPFLSQSIYLPDGKSPEPVLDHIYIELNDQFEKINKELEIRESKILTKEAEIDSVSNYLKHKMEEYKSIEESLIEAKGHLEEFQVNTISEIEYNSKVVVGLIKKLNALKTELEGLVEKVFKQLGFIKKYSLNLEVIQEDPFECTPEVSPNMEIRSGFVEFEEIDKRLKEVERISDSFNERMNTEVTVDSELESSLDEKLRELNNLITFKD